MLYEILKDFPGSQDGRHTEQFVAGTQRELSDYLVSCIDPAWVREVKPKVEIENKAVVSDGSSRPEPAAHEIQNAAVVSDGGMRRGAKK